MMKIPLGRRRILFRFQAPLKTTPWVMREKMPLHRGNS